ncbi:MAG: radical SAM family heme chaperone HemW [Ferruginibacter sp.]
MSGIYIHIPFCKQACHYCNFHFSTSLKQKEEMIAAISNEILLSNIFNHDCNKIETIYFGGGTPSLLSENELSILLDAVRSKFIIAPDAEITLEANPDDISADKLLSWKAAGINRLSIGIQSFLNDELLWMNRAHNASQASDCIQLVKDAGFANFSVDLIYGSPLLSNEDWKKNVDHIIQKNIPHISCYALTVEPETALDKMILQKKKLPVDPDKQAAQLILLMDWLNQTGYEHYEISNFAKPGYRSRHNSSYWQGKNYYGFGPSAHSFDGTSRRWNIANNALYLQALKQNIIPFEEENLTVIQQLNEYIMISLRTMEGLNTGIIKNRFGEIKANELKNKASKYINDKKIEIIDSMLILTEEGKLLADGIAADLFF